MQILMQKICFSIYFRLMSYVIQINADAGELESFLMEYADYPFLALGKVCPVRGCPHFTRYHKFRSLWREKHVDYRLLFKCDICGIVTKDTKSNSNRNLYRKTHKGKPYTFRHKKVQKESYGTVTKSNSNRKRTGRHIREALYIHTKEGSERELSIYR